MIRGSAAVRACGPERGQKRTIDEHTTFDEAEIRAAERALEAALEAPDPTAWVFEYTEDAVFDGGGDHAVQGREALLAMATAMKPLSSVSIRPLRTRGAATSRPSGSRRPGSAARRRTPGPPSTCAA